MESDQSVPNVQSSDSTGTSAITPLQAHYLKKVLIQLQFLSELDTITTATPNNVSTLSYLGAPFAPPPQGAPFIDFPFLRYIFRQFVLTFPFMAAAPKDFYSDKLQPFAVSVLSRNLSPKSVFELDSEHTERATRQKLLEKLERNLSLFMSSAIRISEPEQVVRLTQADLDRLKASYMHKQATALKEKDIFEVNIVSVRTVVDKGRVRSRAHEEFIVRTRRSHHPDCFVSRRYGDFKTLANELRKAIPQEEIKPPPPKDRSSAMSSGNATSPSPMSPNGWSDTDSIDSHSFQNQSAPSKMAREKNRLTLRSYLTGLLSSMAIASSPVMRSFLMSGPTTLTQGEKEDASRREDADRMRDEGRKRFAKEIAARVDSLREAVKSVQGDIMGQDGLTRIFATVKITPDIKDLPVNYLAVIEWARISFASTIFQQYVASDDGSENLATLKRLHGLMPYFMLKTALKVSNPMAMIRGVLDLFLATPFGGKSLLQRMFSSSLTEEARHLEEEIAAVKEKVDDPVICEKLRQFVYAPKEIQDMLKKDADEEGISLVTVILRSGDQPVLSRTQMHRVAKAHRAHALYLKLRQTLVDSDDDDGPEDDDAWLYEDLKVLGFLYSRLRDREQLIDLIFEGVTSDLLKDMLTIFYSPLAQVYRAASIADSLGDLQSFINDLIKTVEQTEELSQEDPHRTVDVFIDLVRRHEQSFYHFVHKVHSKGETLFTSLMQWIELILTIVREGLGESISLEFLLPHTGPERINILKEVDEVAQYHYKLKVLHEDRVRRRFAKAHGQISDADAEDEATQALVDGVVDEINLGGVEGDVEEYTIEESDASSSDSDFTSSEGESDSELSEESLAERTPRSAPVLPPSRDRPPTLSRPPENRVPAPNAKSGTIKKSRSMNFLTKRRSSSRPPSPSRHSQNIAPPLPPLPHNVQSKALPPMPASSGAPAPPPKETLPPSLEPPPRGTKKVKLRSRKGLKPPDLEHIPQLLPVFAELLRPHFRPRPLQQTEQRTEQR